MYLLLLLGTRFSIVRPKKANLFECSCSVAVRKMKCHNHHTWLSVCSYLRLGPIWHVSCYYRFVIVQLMSESTAIDILYDMKSVDEPSLYNTVWKMSQRKVKVVGSSWAINIIFALVEACNAVKFGRFEIQLHLVEHVEYC